MLDGYDPSDVRRHFGTAQGIKSTAVCGNNHSGQQIVDQVTQQVIKNCWWPWEICNIIQVYQKRYEQGLEDYEEAVARVEKVKENQREEALSSVYSLFGNLNSAWEKVNNETDHTTKEVVKRSSDTELDTKEEGKP